jgi:quercetin dioxygenase-like cupin family protein
MQLIKANEGPQVIKGKGLYSHTIYTGSHWINLEEGDTAWLVNKDAGMAYVIRGPMEVETEEMCVVIRGYSCSNKSIEIDGSDTNLPYINGCSTDQLIHPIRPGDPTLQKLTIPPNASEQKHHIHATPRVVFVYEGLGWSLVGMKDPDKYLLEVGDVIILDKMEAHHFETEKESLTVIPLHVYSSTPLEHNHAMKIGTHEI